MQISSYKELIVWQKSMDLAEAILLLSEKFPTTYRFSLGNQMQRAAVSISSNIAEGHSRRANKEFLYFLRIAVGSLAELETQIVLAMRVKLIPKDQSEKLMASAAEIGRMLHGLSAKLPKA